MDVELRKVTQARGVLTVSRREVNVLVRGLEHGLGEVVEETRLALRGQLIALSDRLLEIDNENPNSNSQPACGDTRPHKAHNGFGVTSGMPWCTGVNEEGSGPDWEG